MDASWLSDSPDHLLVLPNQGLRRRLMGGGNLLQWNAKIGRRFGQLAHIGL